MNPTSASAGSPWHRLTVSPQGCAGKSIEVPLSLLGRKTYEIFAAYWPYYEEDAPHGGIAKLFKDIKKYAVSRSGEIDTSWAGSVLLRDISDVRRLKQEDGPNLVTQGSTELVGHYEREGDIKLGDIMLDSPSERETARQKRMKREG